MGNSPLESYFGGLGMGFMIGFLFVAITKDALVNVDPVVDAFWLGVFLMGAVLIAYMIYKDGEK